MDLLKRLSETPGAPGREERVRALIRGEVESSCDSIEEDAMGNLICFRKATPLSPSEGSTPPKRVMVACHMDEIGFYVRHIDDAGFLRLQQLGGFDVRNLFARRVVIQGRRDLIGVMNPSGRPIHIATDEDKKKIPRIVDLIVDTGLSGDEVRSLVRIGDPVCLTQEFVEIGSKVTGKALDNRVACWVGVRLLQQLTHSPFDLYVVFTVQEEVGVRGAMTAAYKVEPHFGIAVDVTLAVDIPGIPEEEQITRLGDGVAIKVMDSYSISDRDLVDRCIALAEQESIPYQLELLPLGGTDAAPVQRSKFGCKAVTLSVPTRYTHTVSETLSKSDLRGGLSLLKAFVEKGFEGQ